MGAEKGAWAVCFYKHKDLLLLEWRRKTPEAALDEFVGLQMQPAETL